MDVAVQKPESLRLPTIEKTRALVAHIRDRSIHGYAVTRYKGGILMVFSREELQADQSDLPLGAEYKITTLGQLLAHELLLLALPPHEGNRSTRARQHGIRAFFEEADQRPTKAKMLPEAMVNQIVEIFGCSDDDLKVELRQVLSQPLTIEKKEIEYFLKKPATRANNRFGSLSDQELEEKVAKQRQRQRELDQIKAIKKAEKRVSEIGNRRVTEEAEINYQLEQVADGMRKLASVRKWQNPKLVYGFLHFMEKRVDQETALALLKPESQWQLDEKTLPLLQALDNGMNGERTQLWPGWIYEQALINLPNYSDRTETDPHKIHIKAEEPMTMGELHDAIKELMPRVEKFQELVQLEDDAKAKLSTLQARQKVDKLRTNGFGR